MHPRRSSPLAALVLAGCAAMATDTVPEGLHVSARPVCDDGAKYVILDFAAALALGGGSVAAIQDKDSRAFGAVVGLAALGLAASSVYGVVQAERCQRSKREHLAWLGAQPPILRAACSAERPCPYGFGCFEGRCAKAGAWREMCMPDGGRGTCYPGLGCLAGRCLSLEELRAPAATPPARDAGPLPGPATRD